MRTRARPALLGGLFLALLACTGDKDDGDGGRLMMREEVRVKEWLRDITPSIRHVGEMDLFAPPPAERLREALRRIERLRPPFVRDNVADRTLREFHDALARQTSLFLELLDETAHGTGSALAFLAAFGRFLERLESVGASTNRIRNLAVELAQTLARDFQDDPQFQSELQATVNNVGRLFSLSGPPGRTLPSLAPATPSTPSQQPSPWSARLRQVPPPATAPPATP